MSSDLRCENTWLHGVRLSYLVLYEYPVEPEVRVSVVTHLENLKATIKGIIPSGSVADIGKGAQFPFSL
jgi:hypothetical protein